MNSEQITTLEQQLIDIQKEIRAEADEFKRHAREAGEARYQYEKHRAIEMVKVAQGDKKVSIPVMEAIVDQAIDEQLKAVREKEGLMKASGGRLDALQSELSAIQTRAGLIKTERSLVSYN